MIRVYSTTDYSRFKMMRGNRPLDRRVSKMVRNIKRKNMLADFPILVRPDGKGRLEVCDGQTRLEAAKQLRLPVFYIETKTITVEDIAEANSAQTPWKPRDYVASGAELGKKDYIKLRAFIEEFRLPPSTSAALLMGNLNGSGSTMDAVKAGRFVIKAEEHARKVAGLIAVMKKYLPTLMADSKLVGALTRCLLVKGFETSRFIDKLKYQSTRFAKCATWHQYVALIEEIYNYKAQSATLLPLSIEVKKLK